MPALEAQIASLPPPAASALDLRTLHEQLRGTDLASIIDRLAAAGGEAQIAGQNPREQPHVDHTNPTSPKIVQDLTPL